MTKPKPSKRPARTSWLARTIDGLLGRKVEQPAPKKRPPAKSHHPTKAEGTLLPPFAGLTLDRIHAPHTAAECDEAARAILRAGVAGFDTEARPTFRAGERSTGPHVVQFALTDRAYIFQLHRPDCQRVAADLIASGQVLKVGFGLGNDHGQIRHRLGVDLRHVLDLDHVFRRRGHHGQIGVRGAIATVLQQSFRKSKKTTTSNWAAPELTQRQLLYAADDAYAALKIMEALNLDPIATAEAHRPRPSKKERKKKLAS